MMRPSTMVIRNPYKITQHIDLNERIETTKGVLTGFQWCEMEARRLRDVGIAAKAVRRNGICYVVRNANGCIITPDDDQNETV